MRLKGRKRLILSLMVLLAGERRIKVRRSVGRHMETGKRSPPWCAPME